MLVFHFLDTDIQKIMTERQREPKTIFDILNKKQESDFAIKANMQHVPRRTPGFQKAAEKICHTPKTHKKHSGLLWLTLQITR